MLHVLIALGLLLGLGTGLLAAATGSELLSAIAAGSAPLGTVFMNAIRMVVIPLVVASLIVGTASLGDITKTWSLSAFCVLIYYGTTNLAALKMPESDRLYPRWISWIGLLGCVIIAFFVERQTVYLGGLALILGITVRRLQPN